VGRSKTRRWADEDEDLLSYGEPCLVNPQSGSTTGERLVVVQMLVPLPPPSDASSRPRLKSIVVRAGGEDPVYGPEAASLQRRRGRQRRRS
jgi:hypothetical protein